MTFDGKLLLRARNGLEAQHQRNLAEQQRRISQIYRQIPEIEQIDRNMRVQMAELVKLTLSKPTDLWERIQSLRDQNLDLQIRRAELLTEHGYPTDYLDDIVSCPDCRDTGYLHGKVCDCLKRIYNRELTNELSELLRDGDESFEHFDLNLYSDLPDSVSGIIPRESMRAVFAGCKKFAQNFPTVSSNLLLRGGTGLGKTYLSACIARVVAEKGYSVCYESASRALEAFERQKFAHDPEDSEKAGIKVQRMLTCDLMILDDLGTEMVTALSLSALYTLINSRLTAGLKTIISTNCSDEELDRRYTPQICSRLHGEFLELPFFGSDLRLKTKHK